MDTLDDNDNILIPQKNITTKTIQSSSWIIGRQLLVGVFNLAVLSILARELRPADFGLVALSQVLLRFLTIIKATGLGNYIIYDNEDGREERVYATFWLNISLASCFMLLAVLLTPLITRFYDQPDLRSVMLLLILRYLLIQFSVVPDALVKKALDFKKLAIRDSILEVTSSLISVVMALTGCGVWSLVLPGVFLAPFRIVTSMYIARWIPRFPLRTFLWRPIFRYSAAIFGSSFAITVASEGDTLIIGRILGTAELGLYNLAFQSASLVNRIVTSVVNDLAMPALSAVSQDTERFRSAYKRMVRLLSIICLPLLIGLMVIADKFILTIYGPQWEATITPMRILIIYAIRKAIISPTTAVYNAIGRPEVGLKINWIFVPVYLGSIFLGARYGIVGVAVGVTSAHALLGFVQLMTSANLAGVKRVELFTGIFSPLVAACLMGLVIGGARLALRQFALPGVLELMILIGIGGISYFLLLLFFFRQLLSDLLVIVYGFSPILSLRVRKLAKLDI